MKSAKHSDPSFMLEPRPWTSDADFPIGEKETVAGSLSSIAMLKAALLCPAYSAADKIDFAEWIEKFMATAGEYYDGPWPDPITPRQLRALRSPIAESARRGVAPHMAAALSGAAAGGVPAAPDERDGSSPSG